MDPSEHRAKVLSSLGVTPSERDELLKYNENLFNHDALKFPLEIPLPDEPFISVWEQYATEASEKGAFESLKRALVQLSFPIQEGISQEEYYRSATRRGRSPDGIPQANGLNLKRPEAIQLLLHQTPVGRLPLIIMGDREDFVALVQAITERNEPAPVPDSMGAVNIAGYNNWDRIRRYREQWERENRSDCSEQRWREEFKRLIPKKELYHDQFIILSDGPYSNISAHDMRLPEEEWKRLSLIIRREHECTHYFTRHLFSSMQNRLIDELMADYMGIVAAAGRYRADWFLRFIGLENFPEYREGGRLENYRGDPPLSDGAFKILQLMAKKASENLEHFDHAYRKESHDLHENAAILIALTCLTMEGLASEDGVSIIAESLDHVTKKTLVRDPPK